MEGSVVILTERDVKGRGLDHFTDNFFARHRARAPSILEARPEN